MDTPQDRVIKKMINNIVEQNKPVFEKPASTNAGTQSAQATSGANETPSVPKTSVSAPNLSDEDYTLLSRKLEYGFNSLRQENAQLRKLVEDLTGTIKMVRSDIDMLRNTVNQRGQASHSAPPREEMRSTGAAGSSAMGAPQYRKTEADEAWEGKEGGSVKNEAAPVQQARGYAKKEEPSVDISKVFYYGKK